MKLLRRKFLHLAFGAAALPTIGNTLEECAAQFRTEIAKWGKVIREAGIKAE
jgi:hypothetical protein